MGPHFGRERSVRWALLAIASLSIAGVAPRAQTSEAASTVPEFAAATIKPVKDADPNRKTDREEGRRFTVDNRTLAELLVMAYHLDRRQVSGGPAWVTTDTYDLTAVAASDADLLKNGRVMFQKLLTGQCTLRREDMQHFSNWLQFAVLDKPVVDKTGLTGEFDFPLKWTPDESQFFAMGIHAPPPSDDPNAPLGLYQAMQEQLGLKLESQKTATQVLVIDHAEAFGELEF